MTKSVNLILCMGLDPAKTIGKERSDMAGATNESSDPWNPRLEPIVLKK